MRGFGVDDQEISPAEFGGCGRRHGPMTCSPPSTSPTKAGSTPPTWRWRYAKGARMGGARVLEGVTVTGVTTDHGPGHGRRHGSRDHHHRNGRECRRDVGPRARRTERRLGPAPGGRALLPHHRHRWSGPIPTCRSSRTPTAMATTARRAAGSSSACSSRSPRPGRSTASPPTSRSPACPRTGSGSGRTSGRDGSLPVAPRRRRPDDVLRPGELHLGPFAAAGPVPELDGYFVAAGLNSLGILLSGGVGSILASWIVDGVAPVDMSGLTVDRTQPFETSRRFRADRTVEQLGALFGDAAWPNWHPTSARNVRRSVIHDRLAAAGAHFAVSSGWEYPEWFAPRRHAPTGRARLGTAATPSPSKPTSIGSSARPSGCSTCR